MELTNSNGFLKREVKGSRKVRFEYIFLEKSLKDCSTVIVLDLELKKIK